MKKELKSEIQKLLEDVPENVLQDILKFLQQIHDSPSDKVQLSQRLSKILSEDGELLQRLAQ